MNSEPVSGHEHMTPRSSHEMPAFERAEDDYWDASFDPERFVLDTADDLRQKFGSARLEETAFTVYTNGLWPARWLGFARIHAAHRYARSVGPVGTAVDFGSGLGVSLPALSARAEIVYAVDRDTEIANFVVDRLKLPNVIVVSHVNEVSEPIDLLYSLDVFEHILDLPGLVKELAVRTRPGGSWIVSGPTENRLYRLARSVARTAGEGHIRGIDRVFDVVSERLCMDESVGLPIDLPMPLTLYHVGLFHKPAER